MVNFPGSLDDNDSLFLAVNNLRTQLTIALTDSATTAEVVTTSGFPPTGYISILTGADILDTEAITYSGTTATEFLNLGRGADGTEALPHDAGDNVDQTIVAQHHNELKDAIIVLEEFVGISGATNFVPKDQFGNVVITGTLDVTGDTGVSGSLLVLEDTTISGALNAGYVVVTGTLETCGDGTFKENLTVSGCLFVGEIPVSGPPDFAYVLDETSHNVTSTSYVDIGVETGPLAVGNNLLVFGASAGSTGSSPSTNLRCLFAGSDVGEAKNVAVNGTGPWGGTNLSHFKMVSGDGVNIAKLQADLDTGGSNTDVSAASILAIPLDDMGLVENTDYWYDNGSETFTNFTTGAGQTTINTLAVTLPEDGDYILFGSMEVGATSSSSVLQSRYYMDGTTFSTNYSMRTETGSTTPRSVPFVRLVTLTAGAHTFEARSQVFFFSSGTARRANLAIIKASAFDQVVGLRSGTNQSSSSSTFAKHVPSEISYTPNQEETLLVFANPDYFIGADAGEATAGKLVNETSGEEWMIDTSGRHRSTTNERHGTWMFGKVDQVSTPQTFSMSFREPEATGNTITVDDVNMVVWGMSTNISAGTQFTTIKGDKITTPDVCADTITVINDGTVTVSGVPVMINVPGDIEINTACINELNVKGHTELNTLTVTGTQAHFDVDFLGVSGTTEHKGDICVFDPYVVKVGKKEIGEVQQDLIEEITEVADPETTWTSLSAFASQVGDTTVPAAGVETAVFYHISMGGQDLNVEPEARVLYDGDEIAFAHRRNGSPSGHRSGTAFQLCGFTVVTGTVDNANFDIQIRSGSTTAINWSTPRIITWPLSDRFERDADYWYDVHNSSTFLVTNAPTTFDNGSSNIVLEATYDLPEAGNYLFFASVEGFDPPAAAAAERGIRCRFSVDGGGAGPNAYEKVEYLQRTGLPGSQDHDASFFTVNRVSLDAGSHTFAIEVASRTDATADFRRPRIFVVKESSLAQVRRDRRTTDLLVTNTSYVTTGLDITYTPTQDEDVMMILTAVPSRLNGNIHCNGRLYNVTNNEYYMADGTNAGTGADAQGGYGGTNSDCLTWNMIHTIPFEDGVAQRVRWETNSQPVAFGQPGRWGFCPPSGLDTPTDFFMFSMNAAPSDEFECVTITGSDIFAHKITVDNVCISGSATISGNPISTGTHTTVNGLGGAVTLSGIGTVETIEEGQVILISGTGGGGGATAVYVHTQGAADSTWNITHGLGTEVINYITYDNSNEQIYPDTFTVVDSNNVTIEWVASQDGMAYIFGDTAPTAIGDLQFAYDAGDGSIVTVSGKPVLISGTTDDQDVEFKVVGSGIFTEALTVGEGSTHLDDHSITTATGIFTESVTTATGTFTDELTVSGIPVTAGPSSIPDPLSIGTINVSTSLTISGEPVATGTTGGGGGTALTVREEDGTPSVSNVSTIVVSNDTLTDDGGGQVTIQTGGTGGGGGGEAGDFSGALVALSGSNQTINTGSTQFIDFDHVEYDTDGYFTVSSGQALTVPASLGITHIILRGQVSWDSNAGTTDIRSINFRKNYQRIDFDMGQQEPHRANTVLVQQAVSPPIPVTAGDEFEMGVFQNSGGNVDVQNTVLRTWFSIEDATPRGGTASGTNVVTTGTVTFSGCYAHVQSVGSSSWSINHNLGSERVNYIVLDDFGDQVQPDLFSVDDADNVTIDFISNRTGIANIFRCVEGDIPISASFDEIVATTGTFTEGLTVGTGTTFIYGDGITSPEGDFSTGLTVSGLPVSTGGSGGGVSDPLTLGEINANDSLTVSGQPVATGTSANFGPTYLGTFEDTGGAGVQFEIPLGYIRYDVHIESAQHLGANNTQTFECRVATVDTPGIFTSVTTNQIGGTAEVGVSSQTFTSSVQTSNRAFLHRNTIDNGMGNDADERWSGVIHIWNPGNSSHWCHATFEGCHESEGGDTGLVTGAFTREEYSPINRMLLRGNAGQTFACKVHLYGWPDPTGQAPN